MENKDSNHLVDFDFTADLQPNIEDQEPFPEQGKIIYFRFEHRFRYMWVCDK